MLSDIQYRFRGAIAALGASIVTRLQNGRSGQIRSMFYLTI